MLHLVAKIIDVELNYELTDKFEPATDTIADFRIAIEPKFQKVLTSACNSTHYYQVFSAPFTQKEFTPWLSVLDLIFNMGPEAKIILNKMRHG